MEAGIASPPFSNSNDLDERVVTVYEMSMGCYLPRVPILTTGWSASAKIRRETRELTGEPVRLAGFGSTAKKEDARYRIPRVKSGEVDRLNTVVVDMVLYEQRRGGGLRGPI